MDTEYEIMKPQWNLLYDSRNDYSTFSLRRSTFTLAPIALYKNRERLAENGYYYNGKKSEVKCYLCGIVTDIDEDSFPEIESKHFDKCKFFHKIYDEESEDEIDGFFDDVPDGPQHKKHELDLIKKENETLTKFFQCRRCKVNRIQTLFLPCRHLVTCEACAESLDFCIHCQEKILGTVKTFIP